MNAASDPLTFASDGNCAPAVPPNQLNAMIAEQGVAQTATFANLLGQGRDLWTGDEEFDRFLDHLNSIRQSKD